MEESLLSFCKYLAPSIALLIERSIWNLCLLVSLSLTRHKPAPFSIKRSSFFSYYNKRMLAVTIMIWDVQSTSDYFGFLLNQAGSVIKSSNVMQNCFGYLELNIWRCTRVKCKIYTGSLFSFSWNAFVRDNWNVWEKTMTSMSLYQWNAQETFSCQ